jgi:hypothetical protein
MENYVEHIQYKIVTIPSWAVLGIVAGLVLAGIALAWLWAWILWPKRRDD